MFFLLVKGQQRFFLFQQLEGFTAGDLPSLSSCLKMSFHTWVRCPGLTLPETIPRGSQLTFLKPILKKGIRRKCTVSQVGWT